MKRIPLVVGLISLLVGLIIAGSGSTTSKRHTWADISNDPATITDQTKYAGASLSKMEKGQLIRATASPKEPRDSIRLVLMTFETYQKYQTTQVTKSEVLVWEDPTSLGQKMTLEYVLPSNGDYVVVIHPLKDNGGDSWENGIPFDFELEIFSTSEANPIGGVLFIIGLVLLGYGIIAKTKPAQVTQATQPAMPLYQPPARTPLRRICPACRTPLDPEEIFCSGCGRKWQ